MILKVGNKNIGTFQIIVIMSWVKDRQRDREIRRRRDEKMKIERQRDGETEKLRDERWSDR